MINKYLNTEETIKNFAEYLEKLIFESTRIRKNFNIVLSGGNTPNLLFKELKTNYTNKIEWSYVHFFWGDERCVPIESKESNYGTAAKAFLNFIDIPPNNIHYINGEEEPIVECERYSNEIYNHVPKRNGLPNIDLIILGLGTDGHTASIFPNQMELLKSDKICDVAVHPETGQFRITITGNVINNANNVSFLVTGNNKANIIDELLNKKNNYKNYPAYYICPKFGKLNYYLDDEASKLIK